ncbi:hypothetical protein J2S28_005634 [Rhizobium sp. SLBN-94]|nr:hypothetical protein [Rhizobium sp. SLBN-94]
MRRFHENDLSRSMTCVRHMLCRHRPAFFNEIELITGAYNCAEAAVAVRAN